LFSSRKSLHAWTHFSPIDDLEPKSSSPESNEVICPRKASSACSGFMVFEVDQEKVIRIVGC
jgi:hypothetical protein